MPRLKIGVGAGRSRDSREAGRAAAAAARSACGGAAPSAALVFCSYLGLDHYAMMAGIREILPGVPLAGGTTFGEICGGELLEGSCVVWLLASPAVRARLGLGRGMARDPFQVGADAARQALESFPVAPRLFLIFYETQMGDPDRAVEGAKSVLGRHFPIAGAGTGSGLIMEQSPFSKQFCGGEVLAGCFVGVLLGGEFAFSCGYSHGGVPITREFALTRARDNVILELDGVPALDVFEEALGIRCGSRGLSYLDVHLAIQEPGQGGADTLRALWGANVAERTLYCGNPVPEGARVRFARVSPDTILERQAESLARARKLLGRPVAGSLCIDCYGRKLTLGAADLIADELRLIQRAAGGAPLAGLYSGSETVVLGWGGPRVESRYCHQSTSLVLFGT